MAVYRQNRALGHFEALAKNYYKNDKGLEAWGITDDSELVCELVPSYTLVPGDGGGEALDLAKLEEHRRKNSLQVTVLAAAEVVAAATAGPSTPAAADRALKSEQSLQLALGTKAGALLEHVVQTFQLKRTAATECRLRLVTDSSLLGASAESSRLCRPSDVVHADDVFSLELGQPLAESELALRVGLIVGNNLALSGGGGASHGPVEIVVPADVAVAELKRQALQATVKWNPLGEAFAQGTTKVTTATRGRVSVVGRRMHLAHTHAPRTHACMHARTHRASYAGWVVGWGWDVG
jgi:hypothetical protein